jgi:hypothetical protein
MATTFLVEHLPHARLGRARADDVDPETRKGIGASPPNGGLVVLPDSGKIIFKRQNQLRRLSVGILRRSFRAFARDVEQNVPIRRHLALVNIRTSPAEVFH